MFIISDADLLIRNQLSKDYPWSAVTLLSLFLGNKVLMNGEKFPTPIRLADHLSVSTVQLCNTGSKSNGNRSIAEEYLRSRLILFNFFVT